MSQAVEDNQKPVKQEEEKQKASLDVGTFLQNQRLSHLLVSFNATGVIMQDLWTLKEVEIRKFCDEKLKCKFADREALTTAIVNKEQTEISILPKAKVIKKTGDTDVKDGTDEKSDIDNKEDADNIPPIPFDPDFCEKKYFEILNNGQELRGTGATCAGFTVYAKPAESSGYNKGIHCWSVKLLGAEDVTGYCYHSVGIVANTRNKFFLSKRSSDDWQFYVYTEKGENSWFSGHRDPEQWNRGEIITIKLNCDDGRVDYYKDGTLFQTQFVAADKSYYFAISSCASKDNYFQAVETPKHIVNI